MRYRTKIVEVEAVPFADPEAAITFSQTGAYRLDGGEQIVAYEDWRVDGYAGVVYDYLHQTWVAFHSTDMMIKGTKGEFYPCDAEVFAQKYEPVP